MSIEINKKKQLQQLEQVANLNTYPSRHFNSKLVNLEVVEIVILEVCGIDTDILLTIKDEILREKLLNVNLLIAKIEALKDKPTPSANFVTKSSSTSLNFFMQETDFSYNSLPQFETFNFLDDQTKEMSSGSTTTHADISLPEIFLIIQQENHEFMCLMFYPPIPPFIDFDFIPSYNDLGYDLDVSSPFGDRNKIYDLGICIEVEFMRFLATYSPVIDTLLPFSSENKDKVFNHGVLASKEKSTPSSSHQGFKASKLFHQKSAMLIYGEDIPILDVLFLHFYPP
ncbi:hypothetical protein Tco_0390818 [Tanacetum coccineum]